MAHESRRSSPLSRRAALGGAGAAVTVGFGQVNRALAWDEGGAMANHPLLGAWAVLTPDAVIPQIHGADGSFIAAFPANYVDPMLGLTFQGSGLGRWEPTGARSGRFTLLQPLSDADGSSLGTWQLAGEFEASEDGQTWVSTATSHIIVRDATNAIVFDEVAPNDPPVRATRIGATIESVALPVATPEGTPTA